MAKQKEFEGMPERTPLGKKATEYLLGRNEIEKRKEALDTIKSDLIKLFISEDKLSIKVEGKIVSYAHLETDQIKSKNANS